MGSRAALRQLPTDGRLTEVPSVDHRLTARPAQAAGFEAVSVTGNGIPASLLGKPDIGPVSLAETAAVARDLAASVDIPLLFDADTGYGSAVNVTRTVREPARRAVGAGADSAMVVGVRDGDALRHVADIAGATAGRRGGPWPARGDECGGDRGTTKLTPL